MWTERNPNIEHVKVFGCFAHMKVTGTHLSKLVDRSKAMVRLGTETGTKAYRLLDPKTGAISINIDVFFDEDKVWPWGEAKKVKAKPRMTFTIEGLSPLEVEEEFD